MTNSERLEAYTLLNLTESDSDFDINIPAETTQQLLGNQRKKRLKKKERDLLKSASSTSYKSSQRICFDCLQSPCEYHVNFGQFTTSWGELFRSALLLISVISLPLLTWLTLHLQNKIAEVEASGLDLPAKFHESHVRLQMVEKNHSAIWTSLNDLTADMIQIKAKLSAMETTMNTLDASLMGNPSLSSLPNNVAQLQKSVATFGASLQDVHTSFKVTAEEHEKVANSLMANDNSIASIQKELIALHSASFLSPVSREGVLTEQPVASAVNHIYGDMSQLSTAISVLNASISLKLDVSNSENYKVFEKQISSLTQRFEEVNASLSILPIQNLTNVPIEIKNIEDILDKFGHNLENLTNSIDVVKGVERKLEGSQVQMASGVSALKQQIQKIEAKVNALTTSISAPLPASKHKRSTDGVYKHFVFGLT